STRKRSVKQPTSTPSSLCRLANPPTTILQARCEPEPARAVDTEPGVVADSTELAPGECTALEVATMPVKWAQAAFAQSGVPSRAPIQETGSRWSRLHRSDVEAFRIGGTTSRRHQPFCRSLDTS